MVPLLPVPVCPDDGLRTQTDAVLSCILSVNRTLRYLSHWEGDLVTHKGKWACRALLMKAVLALLGKGWLVATHCLISGALFSKSYWVYCMKDVHYVILYLQLKPKMI